MKWIQIILFVLTVNGLFILLSIRFNDFIRIMDNPRRSTLQDDLDVLLGKPAKGFFNRETLEIEQLLKSNRPGKPLRTRKKSLHSPVCAGCCGSTAS